MNNMTNKALSGLNNIVSVFKRFRLERIFIVVLAGCLVLVTTACSPDSPRASGSGSYNERVGQPNGLREYTDRADSKSRPDMSSYQDKTTRNSGATQAKAKELSQRARENVKQVQSPGEFVEEYREGPSLGARTRNVLDNVGEAAENFGEDFAEGTRKNTENLKTNADKVGKNAQMTAKEAQRNAKQAADEVADTVRDRA
jgi:hypothetical protein